MTKTYARGLMALTMLLILASGFYLNSDRPVYVDIPTLNTVDPTDKKGHKDFASDVFAAKVERKVGNEPRLSVPAPDMPEDMKNIENAYEQFEVTLTENVKGKLKAGDTITVEQAGGETDSGAIELYEGTPRLKPGEEYLLLTRYDPERKTYGVVAQPSEIVPLDTDKAKKIRQYKGL